jgi:hypothetical protein
VTIALAALVHVITCTLGGHYVRQAAHSASAASTPLCFPLLFFFRIRPVKPQGLKSFVDLYLIPPALPLTVTFVDICIASKVLLAYVFSSLPPKKSFVDLYLIPPALPLAVTFVDIYIASKVLLAYVFSSLPKKRKEKFNAGRLHDSHEY